MDFKQLEYIIKIAEENNITKAAEKLYISQSALNQQLLKLERELGVQLFHRSRTDWGLTQAGEIYVQGAREALRIKKDTYNKINDIAKSRRGTLSVGLTPGRGIRMFTSIYPVLHKDCPELVVTPLEMTVHSQQKALSKGELDIGFMIMGAKQRGSDSYITLGSEEMVVIIPEGHPLSRLAAPPGEPLAEIDIRQLRYEPFVLMYRESTGREVCDDIFKAAGFSPNILLETTNTASIATMVRSTLCCGIIPRYYMEGQSEGLSCFVLPEHPSLDLLIGYRKDSYLSYGARLFIRLAGEYWKNNLTAPQSGAQPPVNEGE